jgi:hypothetical protein
MLLSRELCFNLEMYCSGRFGLQVSIFEISLFEIVIYFICDSIILNFKPYSLLISFILSMKALL